MKVHEDALFFPAGVFDRGLHTSKHTILMQWNLAMDSPSLLYADAVLHCPHPCQHARSYTDLCVNVAQVEFNCFFADAHSCGDRFIGPACEHQFQDFNFTRREIR